VQGLFRPSSTEPKERKIIEMDVNPIKNDRKVGKESTVAVKEKPSGPANRGRKRPRSLTGCWQTRKRKRKLSRSAMFEEKILERGGGEPQPHVHAKKKGGPAVPPLGKTLQKHSKQGTEGKKRPGLIAVQA